MHHKRKRTSRRECARLDEKGYRSRAKQSLRNMEKPYLGRIPSDSWDYRPEPLPMGDVASQGKVRSKKKRPKKEKCPINRVHEWYRETVWKDEPKYAYDSLYDLRTWQVIGTKKVEYKVKTCIHCWKKEEKKIYDRKPWWRGHYKVTLPKRPVRY